MYESTPGQFVNPSIVTSHFHLQQGDSIADFGAGSGHFMKPLAEAVGQSGVVYMCEIQKPLVEALGKQAQSLRLSNVRVMWGDIEVLGGTKIPDSTLNAALLSNTFFQVTHKTELLKEISRTLRPGGKFIFIDWADSFRGLGPRSEEVVTETEAKVYAEAAGFTYERSFPAGEHHYGIAFRKK